MFVLDQKTINNVAQTNHKLRVDHFYMMLENAIVRGSRNGLDYTVRSVNLPANLFYEEYSLQKIEEIQAQGFRGFMTRNWNGRQSRVLIYWGDDDKRFEELKRIHGIERTLPKREDYY